MTLAEPLRNTPFYFTGGTLSADLIQDMQVLPFNIDQRIELRDFTAVIDTLCAALFLTHLPAAEMRWQAAAYRRGVQKILAMAGLIMVVIAALLMFAFEQRNEAQASERKAPANAKKAQQSTQRERNARAKSERNAALASQRATERGLALTEANRHRRAALTAQKTADRKADEADASLGLANRRLREARIALKAEARAKTEAFAKAELARKNANRSDRIAYIAMMNLIQREWDINNVEHVLELLEETKSYKERGFEWGYWNRLCHLDLKTFKGHTDAVVSVSFSPDGKRIVTGSYDNTAKVWNAATGQEVVTLWGHGDRVSSVAFSPDGKRIVTGSSDNTAKIWFSTPNAGQVVIQGH